jgi:hypothetical protein
LPSWSPTLEPVTDGEDVLEASAVPRKAVWVAEGDKVTVGVAGDALKVAFAVRVANAEADGERVGIEDPEVGAAGRGSATSAWEMTILWT